MDNNSIAEDKKPKEEAENGAEAGTEKQSNTDWWEQDSVFKYFVEHTALFIACVSALIAVISFVISAIAYGRDAIYLRMWGIDISYASHSANTAIYYITISILLFTTCTFISWYMTNSFLSKAHQFEMVYEYRHILKKYKDKLRKLRIENKALQKEVARYGTSNQHRRLKKGKKKIELGLDILKKEKMVFRNIHIKLIIYICARCIIPIFITILMTFLMDVYSYEAKFHAALYLLSLTYSVLLIIILNVLRLKRRVARKLKGIKTDALIDCLNREVAKPVEPKSISLKKSISNGVLIQLTVIMVFGLIVTMLQQFASALLYTNERDTYAIYHDQQGVYAIVYHGKDLYIMEKASISEDTITIDKSNQRIIKSSDLSITYQEFDDIVVE